MNFRLLLIAALVCISIGQDETEANPDQFETSTNEEFLLDGLLNDNEDMEINVEGNMNIYNQKLFSLISPDSNTDGEIETGMEEEMEEPNDSETAGERYSASYQGLTLTEQFSTEYFEEATDDMDINVYKDLNVYNNFVALDPPDFFGEDENNEADNNAEQYSEASDLELTTIESYEAPEEGGKEQLRQETNSSIFFQKLGFLSFK